MTRQDSVHCCVVELQHVCACVCTRGALQRRSFIENFWLTYRWFLPPRRRDHGGSKVPDRIFFLFVWTATFHYRCSVRQTRFHGLCRPSFYDMICPRRFVRYPESKITKQKHVCTLDICSLHCARYLFIFAASCRSQAAQSVRSLCGTKVSIPREDSEQYTHWASFSNRFPTILIIRMIRSQSL